MTHTTPPVTVIPAAGGEHLDVFGGPMVVKSDGTRIGFYLAEMPVPPGYGVPPHVHEQDDEAFHILEGELTLVGDGGEMKAGPGANVLLPRGRMHGFRNDTNRTVRVLVVADRGQHVTEMFRHFDRAGRTAGGRLQPTEIVEISRQYGVHMV
ncbi:MAG: cupin domain-containing protein [Acetobacteraceae bacterium]